MMAVQDVRERVDGGETRVDRGEVVVGSEAAAEEGGELLAAGKREAPHPASLGSSGLERIR